MCSLWKFIQSSVGKKFIMGLTGLGLCLFVFGHMTGNLLLFKGAEAYNTYGHMLTQNPAYPLIGNGLIALFVIHLIFAIWLTADNKKARSSRYALPTQGEKEVSLASRTMIYSGCLLAAFVILHLITFKYGVVYTITHSGTEMRDLARLVYEVFQKPIYVIWYVVSLVFLAVHLKHGFHACFQSLGFYHPRYTASIRCAAAIYAFVVALGFLTQPLYVYFVR